MQEKIRVPSCLVVVSLQLMVFNVWALAQHRPVPHVQNDSVRQAANRCQGQLLAAGVNGRTISKLQLVSVEQQHTLSLPTVDKVSIGTKNIGIEVKGKEVLKIQETKALVDGKLQTTNRTIEMNLQLIPGFGPAIDRTWSWENRPIAGVCVSYRSEVQRRFREEERGR